MRHPEQSRDFIRRLPQVLERTGDPRSTFYRKVENGTFTKPVKISQRAVGWPESEVSALVTARIRGLSDDQIRDLVNDLHKRRAGETETKETA
jgi:prophage regulatory protein